MNKNTSAIEWISLKRQLLEGGEQDTSSLGIFPHEPDALAVVGILPHNTRIRLDLPNALKLRSWLDGQILKLSGSTEAPAEASAVPDTVSPEELRWAERYRQGARSCPECGDEGAPIIDEIAGSYREGLWQVMLCQRATCEGKWTEFYNLTHVRVEGADDNCDGFEHDMGVEAGS